MIDTVTVRFDTGEDYFIEFSRTNNNWTVFLETKSDHDYEFLDQAIKACYEDFHKLQLTQAAIISAEF